MKKKIEDVVRLYCVYHEESQKKDYEIKDTEWFKGYYTKEGHLGGIDDLQEFFCEFTAQWWIYKCNLKSPLIGFCHYRRQFIRQDLIEGKVDMSHRIWGSWPYRGTLGNLMRKRFNGFLLEDLQRYVKENYDPTSRIYQTYVKELEVDKSWLVCECYLTYWKEFTELMKFLVGFFEEINQKYNLQWKPERYREFIEEQYINKRDWTQAPLGLEWLWTGKYRIIAHITEVLIGYYFGFPSEEKKEKEDAP